MTRRRWIVVVGSGAGLALTLAGWLVVRYVAVPWAVRRALAAGGLTPARFEIESVGLRRLRLVNVSAGARPGAGARPAAAPTGPGGTQGLSEGPWLTAGAVDVKYRPAGLASGRVDEIAVRDAVWTVRVGEGTVDWGFAPPASAGPVSLELPLDRASVSASRVRIETKGRSYEVGAEATLEAGSAGIRGRLGLAGMGSSLDLRVKGAADAGVLGVEVESGAPAVFNLEASGISGSLASISGRLHLTPDGAGGTVAEGTLSVRGGEMRAGDMAIRDLEAGLTVGAGRAVGLTGLTATVGDGGTLRMDPFVIDPGAPIVRTRVSVANLSMAEWVPLVTGQHATGQGRVSGDMEIAVDLTGGTARVTDLSGGLEGTPQHGFIQVSDAAALGALLESQDPRFATEEVMGALKDKIVAALQDFAFERLTVDLGRQGNFTVATVHLSGFGRHGEDPQGLNLTLNVHAQDTILQLASRIESLAKVKSAAQAALERFYGTPDAPAGPTR